MMALISRLMSHYWTADDPVPTRQAQLEDWIEDLAEFGPDIVKAACAEWRRSTNKRPTPADIRVLAIVEQNDQRQRTRHDQLPVSSPAAREAFAERRHQRDRDMIAGGRAIENQWARERGYADIEAYEVAESIDHAEVCCRAILSKLNANATPAVKGFRSLASSLGVTAREYNPTDEQMAAGRRELGLDPPGDEP